MLTATRESVNFLLGIHQMPLMTTVKSPKYMFAFLCGQLLLESRFENTCCFIFLRGRGKGRGRITTQNWGDDGDILDISPVGRVKVIWSRVLSWNRWHAVACFLWGCPWSIGWISQRSNLIWSVRKLKSEGQIPLRHRFLSVGLFHDSCHSVECDG